MFSYDFSAETAGHTIHWDRDDYIVNDAVEYAPVTAVDPNFRANVHWKGVGGHHTYRATRIQLIGGNSTTAGLTLKSCVQMSFEDIDFIGATGMLALIKIMADGPDPNYSSFNITFRRCRFATTTPIVATVLLSNCSNITFEHCFFQGAATAVQIGTDASDSENAGTFGGGTADQIEFRHCFFSGDVVIRRCRGVLFDLCIFDRNSTSNEGSKIYASGDQAVRGLTVQNCWAGYGLTDTGTWLVMGTAGYGLRVENCYVSKYQKAMLLNGIGVACVSGNEFALSAANATAIDIESATFFGDNIHNNNFNGMNASAIRVQDARSNPGAPATIFPIEVNQTLDADLSMTNIGGGFVDVLTATVKVTGGHYRVHFAATIETGGNASEFQVRINLDSQTPRVGGIIYIPANSSSTFAMTRDVWLEGTTGNTTARLQIYQVTGPNAATVKATSTVRTTMMQLVAV